MGDSKGNGDLLIQFNTMKSSSLSPKTIKLFKIATLFFGITALIPNAVILTDLDFFKDRVIYFLSYFLAASS